MGNPFASPFKRQRAAPMGRSASSSTFPSINVLQSTSSEKPAMAVGEDPLPPEEARQPDPAAEACKQVNILYLFAGKERHSDIKSCLQDIAPVSWHVVFVEIDLVRSPEHDVSDDEVWQRLLHRVRKGEFSAVLAPRHALRGPGQCGPIAMDQRRCVQLCILGVFLG